MPHHAEMPLWDDKSDSQKIMTLKQMVDDLYESTFVEARHTLDSILAEAIPADNKEAQDIATMRELLARHPNILSPNCEIGHFTASALVCDHHGNVLLHYHKNLKKWLQFGGHADTETDFAEVALRETREETGLDWLIFYDHRKRPIDFDIHTIPANKGRPEHLHLDIRYMLMTIKPNLLNPQAGESQEFVWASYQDILNPTDPDEADKVDDALKRLIRKCEDRFHNPHKYRS